MNKFLEGRVLVLGAEGFVGSHLSERFSKRTTLDDRSFHKHTFPDTIVKDIGGDIESEVAGASLVIHAACRDIRNSMRFPLDDARTNILGTLNVLGLCRKHNVPFFYISSVSVHREVNHYAVSKSAAERYTRLYRQWIPTAIVRLSNVFGPRDTESVIAKWLKSDEITLIDEGATRDFTFIEDTLDGILRTIEVWPEEIPDIGTGIETNLSDLAEWLAQKTRKPVKKIAAREIDNVRTRVVDADRTEKLIGFRSRWNVRDALETLIKS